LPLNNISCRSTLGLKLAAILYLKILSAICHKKIINE
jgi:hypothetical protein